MPSQASPPLSRAEKAKLLMEEDKRRTEAALDKQQEEEEGGTWHVVQQGETLESIAKRRDQEPEAIWDHPENEPLRRAYITPKALKKGDRLFIPNPDEPIGTGPVGKGEYVVKDGDSIESIAFDKGYFWETLWNHPDNAELKEIRKDRNILLPGDRVTLPAKTAKQEPAQTEMRHRFVRRGVPAYCALQLFQDGEPRANQEYTLTVGEEVFTGVTDAEGKLKHPISPGATTGTLVIGPDRQEFPLRFGKLDPITELSGIQKRLNNLGFPCGAPSGQLDDRTRAAIRAFQERMNLPPTGEPDSATVDRLRELHDEPQQYPPEQRASDPPAGPQPAPSSGSQSASATEPPSHARAHGAPGSHPNARTED